MNAHYDVQKTGTGTQEHVHPIARVLANFTDAVDIECCSWERGQHYLYYELDGFEVMPSTFDRDGVSLLNVEYDDARDQMRACVFVKEVQTASVFERMKTIDGELQRCGHVACNWYGERRRKRPATA